VSDDVRIRIAAAIDETEPETDRQDRLIGEWLRRRRARFADRPVLLDPIAMGR
jgi:hypothetical protein